VSNLFGGGAKVASMTPTRALGIQFMSSQYGPPVPVVYGTGKVGGTCIWYGDFASTSHSQKVGKGGGSRSTSYTYSASFMLGLCEGPVTGFGTVYDGTSTVDLNSVGAVTATGTAGQAPWSHLSGAFALGYSNTAWVAVQNMQLGSSASLPNWNVEVRGFHLHAGSSDANPADILTDICTDTTHGIDFNYLGDLTQYSNYCIAAGLLLSPVYDKEQTAQQTLGDLFKFTNSAAYFSEGVLKVVPYGDTSITGNGVTYSPNNSPLVNLGAADFLVSAGEDAVQITRKAPADAMNMVRVQYQDRSNSYHNSVVVASIDEDVVVNGARADTTEDASMCKVASTARFIAQNLVQRSFFVRNTYEFKLGWRYCYLEPMDIVTLTDASTGLNQWPVRIIDITEDENGDLSITAEEYPEGVGHSAIYNTQPNNGGSIDPNTDPGAVNPPYIFRGPGFLVSNAGPEIWLAVNGSNALWGGAEVYLSHDGNSYSYVGTVAQPARYGSLTTALGTGSDPDTTNTPEVTVYAPGQLLGGSQADADNLVTLAMVDGEIISYETSTLVSSGTYQLGYLRRGAYGSAIASHTSGAPFVRLDDAIFCIPIDPSLIGQTVYLKFLSINSFGRTPRSLSSETAYSYVVGTNVELPDVPPVPASFATQGVADGVSITWSNSNPAAVGCTSIERSTSSSGPWTVIAQVGPTTTGYTDHFTNGATYYYRARARGPLVSSGWSAYTSTFNSSGTNVSAIGTAATQAQGQANSAPVINGGFDIAPTGYGWTPDAGTNPWYTDTSGDTPGVGPNCARRDGSGSAVTIAYRNNGYVACQAGQVYKAQGLVKGITSPDGSAYVYISWLNASLVEIGTKAGNQISGNTTAGSFATGVAPAGTQYARTCLGVSNHSAGSYLVDNVLCSQYPSSVDEVPDGSNHVRGVALSTSEVVDNANFELPLNADGSVPGWKPFGTGQIYLYTAAPYQGSQSLQINCPAQYDGAESTRKYACSPGEVYFVSCALASNLGGYSKMQVRFYNGSGSAFSSVDTTSSAFSFQVLSATVTVPSGAVYFTIAFHNDNTGGGGVFYVDTVTVARVRSLDSEVADGSTYLRMPGSNMDANRRGLIDFTQAGHLGKTVDNIGDGTTYARIYGSDLSGGKHRIGIAGSGYQIGDQRNLKQRTVTNIPAKVPTVINYSASAGTPATATISVPAFTILNGSVTTAYNASSASVTGTNGTTVTYYLYFNDPAFAGGTQVLVASTNGNDVYGGDGYVYIGSIAVTFPTDGGGSGSGGGGGSCVCAHMWLDEDTQARECVRGYLADCLDLPTSGMRKFRRRMLGMEMDVAPCVRITTAGGAVLECSTATPFDLLDGRTARAPDMEGEQVVTDRGIERVVSVIDIGEQLVCHQHYGGCSYAAGADPSRRIYSHNMIKP